MEVRYPSIPLALQLQLDKLNTLLTPLPAPQTKVGAGVTAVGATSWAALPGIQTISLDLPRPAWVTVTAGAWMQPLSGTSDVRAGIALSGATTVIPQDYPGGGISAWGEVMWAYGDYVQSSISKEFKVNAGVTVFTLQAYVYAGSGNVNYPSFTVTPRAWESLDPIIVEPED